MDYVNHRDTVFDIGGNKYRLITKIDYVAQVVNVKRAWTHGMHLAAHRTYLHNGTTLRDLSHNRTVINLKINHLVVYCLSI